MPLKDYLQENTASIKEQAEPERAVLQKQRKETREDSGQHSQMPPKSMTQKWKTNHHSQPQEAEDDPCESSSVELLKSVSKQFI